MAAEKTAGELVLSRTRYPVTTLGPGLRAGIWTQGCTIGCAGCMSRDTWDPEAGTTNAVADVLAWLRGLPDELSGVTVSGGEPFQQPDALCALLCGIRDWSSLRPRPVDVMVYSGYTTAALRRSPRRAEAMDLCDVVVTGPYIARRAPGGRWRGSANQRIEVMTRLGHDRFATPADEPSRGELEMGLDDGRWWIVGVPRPGDLERAEDVLARHGIAVRDVSWRARP